MNARMRVPVLAETNLAALFLEHLVGCAFYRLIVGP